MKFCLFVLSVLFFSTVCAQDQLFKTDNTKINVKVLEVGPEEIKYKRFDNLNGPTYIESKKNVTLILYENGQHQVIGPPYSQPTQTQTPTVRAYQSPPMSRADSITFYGYNNSLGINFLNFFNNEMAVLYRREFFRSQFCLVIPMALGLSKPTVTQSFYFSNDAPPIELISKKFEAGVGIYYYPSLKTRANYYIGPVFRFMQFDCHQQLMTPSWPSYMLAENYTVLNRTSFSITNGVVYRTLSRLTLNMFISLGFKNDAIDEPLRDGGGTEINTIPNPLGFSWWSGFEIGFNF